MMKSKLVECCPIADYPQLTPYQAVNSDDVRSPLSVVSAGNAWIMLDSYSLQQYRSRGGDLSPLML